MLLLKSRVRHYCTVLGTVLITGHVLAVRITTYWLYLSRRTGCTLTCLIGCTYHDVLYNVSRGRETYGSLERPKPPRVNWHGCTAGRPPLLNLQDVQFLQYTQPPYVSMTAHLATRHKKEEAAISAITSHEGRDSLAFAYATWHKTVLLFFCHNCLEPAWAMLFALLLWVPLL